MIPNTLMKLYYMRGGGQSQAYVIIMISKHVHIGPLACSLGHKINTMWPTSTVDHSIICSHTNKNYFIFYQMMAADYAQLYDNHVNC